MLDLRRLQVFREVAAQRSFSGAALALNYTQSSVSQQVTNLERDLGATLIDRTARPVGLTAAGEVVLRHADDLVARAELVERDLAVLASGETGTLRVGAFYTAWATFLPSAVAAYSRRRPDVQLELRQLEPEPALRELLSGELDIAVVYRLAGIDDEDDDRIAWTHLLDDHYAVALPARHRLTRASEVALADLEHERWLSPPPGAPYSRLLRRLCRDHGGFEPDVAYETGDIAMAQPLVAAGLAVALLPDLGLRPRHAGVAVRPLPDIPPARSVEIARLAAHAVPAAEPMADALRDAARKV
jgi:DNA-binding transcriptional LysR family regulator